MSKPAYLLKGESFLVDEALEQVHSETETDPLSQTSLDATAPAAEILNALETPTLLGGRRLVVLRDAHDLKKEQTDALARYLASPSPFSILVLVASGRTKLEDAVKKVGAVVALDPPKGRRLVAWIRDRARTQHLKLDEGAAWALLDSVGSELRDLDGALEQLATALGRQSSVGAPDVRRLFPRLADERTFAFTDAVGDRRLPQAMTALRRLLEQEEHPLMLLGAVTGQIRRMVRARHYAEGGPQAVGDALGLPAWRAERLAKQARSYREEELVIALEVLARADVEMKGGDLPAELALERAVLQIVSGDA